MRLNIVLVEPEIPPNTGNVVRTAAATGFTLHLVRPLGFDISERSIRRAGLDYWDKADVRVHDSWQAFEETLLRNKAWFFTTKAAGTHCDASYQDGDYLIFGKETRGLDEDVLRRYRDRCLRVPMLPGIRSLNLSNTVAVVVYEALRQEGFPGFVREGELPEA